MRDRRISPGTGKVARSPAVAGSFYPGLPNALSTEVRTFIDGAPLNRGAGQLVGLIVPHAGYAYSGQIAGHAYRQLAGRSFDTVVLIGLSHRYVVHGAAIYAHGMFRTPLGDVEIDEDFAVRLMAKNANVRHVPAAHEDEHSLEVQLPFLQESLPGARIVPILLQDDSPRNVGQISESIVQAVGKESVLLIGSTDLSHYPAYAEAVQSDRALIETMSGLDADALRVRMREYMKIHRAHNFHCMMCSPGAIYTVINVVREIGAKRMDILNAANSGDVPTGQKEQVVGYMAAAMYAHA